MRITMKLIGLMLVTGVAAAVPMLVRVMTFGADGPATRFGIRCCQWWSRVSLSIVGVRLDVHGLPADPPFLVAANHVSYLDIWILGSLYPGVFVAKREIASWPIFGWIARASGTLFVDRDTPRDLLRTSREIGARLANGVSLTLFPEGQATDGREVLPFMPPLFQSAARGRVPCWAATLGYDTPGSADPPADTVCWWGGQTFFPHLRRLLRAPEIRATVRFDRSAVVSSDRKELARVLHERVAARFIPVPRRSG